MRLSEPYSERVAEGEKEIGIHQPPFAQRCLFSVATAPPSYPTLLECT